MQSSGHTSGIVKKALLIGAAVLGIALVLGFTVFTGSSARAAKPALRITRSAPMTVQGRHFRAGERVRVTTGSRSTRGQANGGGMFVVVIPGADRCNTVRVLARGSAGSYAVVKLLPAPMCAPARSSSSSR